MSACPYSWGRHRLPQGWRPWDSSAHGLGQLRMVAVMGPGCEHPFRYPGRGFFQTPNILRSVMGFFQKNIVSSENFQLVLHGANRCVSAETPPGHFREGTVPPLCSRGSHFLTLFQLISVLTGGGGGAFPTHPCLGTISQVKIYPFKRFTKPWAPWGQFGESWKWN